MEVREREIGCVFDEIQKSRRTDRTTGHEARAGPQRSGSRSVATRSRASGAAVAGRGQEPERPGQTENNLAAIVQAEGWKSTRVPLQRRRALASAALAIPDLAALIFSTYCAALRERQTAKHVARFEVVRRAVPGIIGLRCHSYRPLLHF